MGDGVGEGEGRCGRGRVGKGVRARCGREE